MVDAALQDLRFAARSLLHTRGVTAIAVLSLSLGLAANTTVFSLVQAVEFPRLIYPEASRIVFLESNNHTRGLVGMPVSAPDARDIASASRTLAQWAVTADQTSILRGGTPPFRVSGRRVMPQFFDVMGVPAELGRVLREGDGPDTIVLSEPLWRSSFGADPAIAGRSIRFDGGTVTVAGVMPAGFDSDADFWVLLDPRGFARDDRQLALFARLEPTASLRDARTEIEQISRRLANTHPSTNRDWTTIPIALTRLHGRDSRRTIMLLQGAVLFVLLIACSNVANLLLARTTRRRHEIAVRTSLGATRVRLVQGLLAESLLLSLAGGGLGVLLSMWAIPLAKVYAGIPDAPEPTLNLVVLLAAAALAIATGVISGVLPALRAAHEPPAPALRGDDWRTGASSGMRFRTALVAAQIACALVLTSAAVLMVRTLMNRQQVDLGFEPRGAIRANLPLTGARYEQDAAVRATVEGLLDRMTGAPDIAAAGVVTWALPTGAGAQRQLTRPSQRDLALATAVRRGIEAVTPAYFDALGIPIRAGRPFSPADREGSAPVAIVNEEIVRHLWPDRDPVGQLLRLGAPGEDAPVVTVVGVAGTVRRSGMHDVAIARVYVPFAQHPNRWLSLVIRARGDLRAAERELHAAVEAVDPALFAEGVRTLDADVAQFIAPIRRMVGVLTGFGAAGLLLAALGVFGTMSYVVSLRERELALRAALGADRRDIVSLVYAGALRMTMAGILVGVPLALAATRALEGLLYGVSPADPLTVAAAILVLSAAALAACYPSARLAVSVDPLTLLRR